jgi:hypothetical protein
VVFALLQNSLLEQWWFVVSFLLLIFLGCVALLTWFAGNGNVKMGTYVQVFHEQGKGWHSRHSILRDMDGPSRGIQAQFLKWVDKRRLDQLLAAPHLLLGLISLGLPWFGASTEGHRVPLPVCWVVLIVAGCLWFGLWLFLLIFKTPSKYYTRMWKEIRENEPKQEMRDTQGA